MNSPSPHRGAPPPAARTAASTEPEHWIDHPATRHAAAVLLAFLVPAVLRWIFEGQDGRSGLLHAVAVTLGVGLLVAGLLLYLWWVVAAWKYRDLDSWMTPWMFGQGPTAFSRHPGWLAVIMIVVAQAMIGGGWAAWIYALLVVGALNAWVHVHEEPRWAVQHPEEFPAYRARVARWLPWATLLETARDLGALLRNSVR